MTAITSRFKVVEVEPEIRALHDRFLVVRVQVPVAACERYTQFFEHNFRRRRIESKLAELSNDLGLPATIDASPAMRWKLITRSLR